MLKIRPGSFPNGGFPFTDPRTGRRFDGMSVSDTTMQARKVIEHRLANPRIYPQNESQWFSLSGVIAEVVLAICSNNPDACMEPGDSVRRSNDTRQAPIKAAPSADVLCPQCGAGDWEMIYSTGGCKSCGKKLSGRRCRKCGHLTGK